MIRPFLMLFAAVSLAAPVAAKAETHPDKVSQAPDNSPLFSSYHVASVSPLYEVQTVGRGQAKTLRGARVRILAEPGMTAELLQRRVNEHVAQMSPNTAGMGSCPLAVPGIRTSVSSSGDGYYVNVRAENKGEAKEVLRRANLLVR